MATTETIVNGTGSNGNLNSPLSFSFAYLKIEDVKVELQKFKVSSSKVKATATAVFTIDPNQPTQVILSAINAATDYQNADGSLKQNFADPNGDSDLIVRARIYRLTGTDVKPATFVNGTSIRAKDLNDNFDQFLFTMQERQSQIEALETGQIADGAIGTAELEDDAVDSTKLKDDATGEDGAVTTNHIRDDAVTTRKLAHDITIQNDLTVSNNLAVSNVTTFTGNINIDGSSLKLKFRDSGGTNYAILYSNGTDFRLELKDAINDFKIFDGTTLRYTFADNGNLTCTGSVTATSFVGNADTATTATTSDAVNIASSGFGDASNRPIACFGTSSTPSGGGSSQIKFPNSNAPTIKGDGLLKANNGIEVTGNVDATGNISATDITATGDLNGTLGNSQVRTAIALGSEGQKGTYAFCTLVNSNANRAAGYEAAGSDLLFSNADANANGTPNNGTGTWRLMGYLAASADITNPLETSLWLRIF